MRLSKKKIFFLKLSCVSSILNCNWHANCGINFVSETQQVGTVHSPVSLLAFCGSPSAIAHVKLYHLQLSNECIDNESDRIWWPHCCDCFVSGTGVHPFSCTLRPSSQSGLLYICSVARYRSARVARRTAPVQRAGLFLTTRTKHAARLASCKLMFADQAQVPTVVLGKWPLLSC